MLKPYARMSGRLVTGIIVGLFVGAATSGVDAAGSDFTFAVLGDRTGGAVEGVFEQVVRDVDFLAPDLIMTVGDLIEGYLADSAATEAEWDYGLGLLDATGIPYHLTPGNHDIWDPQSRRIYSARVGSPDTAFVFRNNLFVILDVSTEYKADRLSQTKIDRLERELAGAGRYEHTFVFYHKPFWCEDFSFERPNRLHDIFKRHGVDAVFTGHYHKSFYTEQDGIRYFGVSSSGGSLPPGGRAKGCFYSYMLARVEGDYLEVRMLEPAFGAAPDLVTLDDALRVAALEDRAVDIEPVEITDVSLDGTTGVRIGLRNTGSTTLKDKVRWIPAGEWAVEPLDDYIEIPPGETGTMTAYVSNEGTLFPVPRLEINMAYDGGEPLTVSEALPVKRLIYAAKPNAAPSVDGRLEGIWETIPAESRFFGSAPGRAPSDSTVLRLCHDETHLYVAVEAFDSVADSIAAHVRIRDGFGSYDDLVVLLLEPEIGSDVFYQVAVNPAGTIFDKSIEICPFGTYVQDPAWDAPVEVGTDLYEDKWVAEIAIPLEAVGARPEAGARWGFNFRRMHGRLDATSDFQAPFWFASDRLGILILR
jgi:hypothetical protein